MDRKGRSLRTRKVALVPCWVRCPLCDDFWCEKHRKHVYDCRCPSIEVWAKAGVSPYKVSKPGERLRCGYRGDSPDDEGNDLALRKFNGEFIR